MSDPIRPSSNAGASVDAVDLLYGHHDAIAHLFDRYQVLAADDASSRERRDLASEICATVGAHVAIEREIVYPALRPTLGNDMIDIACGMHDGAAAMIAELRALDAGDPRHDGVLLALADLLERHADLERDELFPRVRSAAIDLRALRDRMSGRQGVAREDVEIA